MAEEIFIADKKTLDETKKNTNDIIQNTKFIKEQFPLMITGGGTDWKEYKPCNYRVYAEVGDDETKSALKITGKGYVAVLLSDTEKSDGYQVDIQIVIDDVPVLRSDVGQRVQGENYPGGIAIESMVLQKDDFKKIYEYPSNNKGNKGYMPIAQPLFFEKSLEVNFIRERYSSNSISKACFIFIGGIKA